MFLYNSRSYSPSTILAIPKPASPSTNITMKQQQAESINNTVNHMVELFMWFFILRFKKNGETSLNTLDYSLITYTLQ